MLTYLASASSNGPLSFDNVKCNEISAPIGTVDMEINLYMTGEGWQLEIINNNDGTTDRSSERWVDTFSEE
jgi:hypothetical protein